LVVDVLRVVLVGGGVIEWGVFGEWRCACGWVCVGGGSWGFWGVAGCCCCLGLIALGGGFVGGSGGGLCWVGGCLLVLVALFCGV